MTSAASRIVSYFVAKTGNDFDSTQEYMRQIEIANELLESYPFESIVTCIDKYYEKIRSLAYLSYVVAEVHHSLLASQVNASILDGFKNWEAQIIDGKEVAQSTPRWITTMKGGGEHL